MTIHDGIRSRRQAPAATEGELEVKIQKKSKAMFVVASALALVAGAASLYATVSVASTNVPVAIPDNGSTTSTLVVDNTTVPNPGSVAPPWNITDVNVQFSVTHTWDDDVLIQIASPAVAAVTIMQNCGGSADNFTNTVIDDAGAVANCAFAGAPFTGTFQAMQGATPNPNATALAAFNGTDAFGTWTLTAADDSTICTGTLTAWSVTLDGASPLPVELTNFSVE